VYSPFLPQFFSAHQNRDALSDVREQAGEFSVRRLSGEFQQDFAFWTGDSLRIGKVFMNDPLYRPIHGQTAIGVTNERGE